MYTDWNITLPIKDWNYELNYIVVVQYVSVDRVTMSLTRVSKITFSIKNETMVDYIFTRKLWLTSWSFRYFFNSIPARVTTGFAHNEFRPWSVSPRHVSVSPSRPPLVLPRLRSLRISDPTRIIPRRHVVETFILPARTHALFFSICESVFIIWRAELFVYTILQRCSTRKCFQQRLSCFNTRRTLQMTTKS